MPIPAARRGNKQKESGSEILCNLIKKHLTDSLPGVYLYDIRKAIKCRNTSPHYLGKGTLYSILTLKFVISYKRQDGFASGEYPSMKKHPSLIWLLCLALFSGPTSFAQSVSYGAGAGLVAAFGNKFDRLGMYVRGYCISGQFQLNADLRGYLNLKNLGPPGAYPEISLAAGLVYAYGRKDTLHATRFLSDVSNQTTRSNSIGYAHTFYLNTIRTSQHTGTFSLEFNRFHFISENDILGHSYYDRFRTGAILLQYTLSNTVQVALNCSMWTGQIEHRVRAPEYPYPNGYMDTTGGRYSRYSHGLLSLQANTVLPFFDQQAQINAGVDAEQVRNVLQNRIIHDLVFLPRKWRSDRNAHMPMIDDQGAQYLFREGQRIRKPQPYLNGFLNPSLFY
jgi:hypothetical protein